MVDSLEIVFDPVCGMAITRQQAAAWQVQGKVTYYFCSAACYNAFMEHTGRYVSKRADVQ